VLPEQDASLFGRPNDVLKGHAVTPSSSCQSKTFDPKSQTEPPSSPSPHLTLGEIRRDMQETRITSSKSPSPLKVPSLTSTQSGCSPGKVPNQVRRALHESITSLLGKRSPEEDEEDVHAPIPQTRAGKRARPLGKLKVRLRVLESVF
jgi:DNA replication regulator DPB11